MIVIFMSSHTLSTNSHNKKPRVLFVLKKRDSSWGQTNPYSYNSSGLLNSAKFVNDMLIHREFESKLVEVIDSNFIDREVFQYNPDIVILEAIWCPPAKLKELVKLNHHKHRKWIVRNHSEFPFLAFEGIAVEWITEYATIENVTVSCNSPTANSEMEALVNAQTGTFHRVYLLPNYYPTGDFTELKKAHGDTIDVGCFGAIRPLKNNFEQALASIIYAYSIGKKLRFHINSTRIEGNAGPVLKSIRALFEKSKGCRLIEEPWMERAEFLELCKNMDMGLQVSYSETFNIVAADLISQGVPVVCSDEIPWMPSRFCADPSSALDIADKMVVAHKSKVKDEFESLKKYSNHSEELWVQKLHEIVK